MSSPPYSSAVSPPPLTNPRKRPSVITTPHPPQKRRKASLAPSAASSAHPLRQTSFPPPEAEPYSPTSRQASFSPAVGTDILSVASKSRKAGKRKGKNAFNDAASSTAPTRRATGAHATSTADAPDAPDDEDDEDEDFDAFDGAKEMDAAESKKMSEYRAILYEKLTKDQEARFDIWNRVALKRPIVRKIANQTVSQSVPQSIVLTIGICAKVFSGDLIEMARQVQQEWRAAEMKLPTGEDKLKKIAEEERAGGEKKDGKEDGKGADVKVEGSSPAEIVESVEKDEAATKRKKKVDIKEALFHVEERDKGPLTPDHLREALRRYKRDRQGGGAGLQGMSLHGREAVAARTSGRRLFR